MLLSDLPCERNFYRPWLATSLQDFWSRRWNLMASNNLRDGVYLPIISAFSDYPEHLVRPAGVFMCFLMSGVFHEIIFMNVSGSFHGYWLAFFPIQGVACLIERYLEQRFIARTPVFVRWFITLSFLMVSSKYLFFLPLVKSDLKNRFFENITQWTELVQYAV